VPACAGLIVYKCSGLEEPDAAEGSGAGGVASVAGGGGTGAGGAAARLRQTVVSQRRALEPVVCMQVCGWRSALRGAGRDCCRGLAVSAPWPEASAAGHAATSCDGKCASARARASCIPFLRRTRRTTAWPPRWLRTWRAWWLAAAPGRSCTWTFGREARCRLPGCAGRHRAGRAALRSPFTCSCEQRCAAGCAGARAAG
jgi:hypothetical protein